MKSKPSIETKVCTVAALIITWGVVARAGPSIVAQTKSVDFGTFKTKDASQSEIVTLKNTGDSDLIIKSIHPGCGCISTRLLDALTVAPGGVCRIKLILNAERATVGSHAYLVKVLSNDPQVPVVTFAVKYTYAPDIELSAPEFVIQADSGKPSSTSGVGSASIRLRDTWDQRLHIESVSSTNPFLENTVCDVEYTMTTGRKVHYITVSAILAPGWPVGPVDEKLILETNHPDYDKIVLPVRGEVTGPVKISPSVVLLDNLHRGEQFAREVVLESPSDIVMGKIWSESDTMKVDIVSPAVGKRMVLKITGLVPLKDKEGVEGLYWEAVHAQFIKPRRYTQVIRVWGPIDETATVQSSDGEKKRDEQAEEEPVVEAQKSESLADGVRAPFNKNTLQETAP
ncbi:MAG: Ig-like domain-containing protein [Planctomycetota bacterium]|jgi:hypothetical protein